MTNQGNGTLIGGLLALGGVLLGGLISLAVEALRRRWSLSDRTYERRKEVLDNRCAQAEAYAREVEADFRRLMHDAEAYLLLPDQYEAVQRQEARRAWKDHLDTTVFALGPTIGSLSNEALTSAWGKMMEAMDHLHNIYIRVCDFRFGGSESLDPKETISEMNRIWLNFAGRLADFYQNVDEIRIRNLERRD